MTDRSYPDPCLSASIFCTESLDRVLMDVLAPFRQRIESLAGNDSAFVWTIRYNLNGQHLKLRLHGPDEIVEPAREDLEERVGRFFSALPGDPEPTPPRRWQRIPPVDLEDEAEEDYPDRSLLWTTYRRSDVSLARLPFYEDDAYVAAATRAMGRGTDLVLEGLADEPADQIRHTARQQVLLKSILVALRGFGFSFRECHVYLAFHRDWLVRFALLKSEVGREASRKLLEKLDGKADAMESMFAPLRASAESLWSENAELPTEDQADSWTAYGRAMEAVADRARELAVSSEFDVDPFAPHRYYPPLFKALHAQANQLGLNMIDEAFAYHLLLRATDGASDEPVVLVPRRRSA